MSATRPHTLNTVGAHPFEIAHIDVVQLRAPIDKPVKTSFGEMSYRPAVLVRVIERQGVSGWGEVWCNFPAVAAEHRVRLLKSVVVPQLIGRSFDSAYSCFRYLTDINRILALQAGEPGPFAHIIAGLDTACWDLLARRADQPLCRLLNEQSQLSVPAYASGIHPDRAMAQITASRQADYHAFKLKVGFNDHADLACVSDVCANLGADESLMLDANQAWEIGHAVRMISELSRYPLKWLEEPIASDRPASE